MRINILQHTPNEGPGYIREWALDNNHDIYIYHPYWFDHTLPKASETDMLIILGGPMSPNDTDEWILRERALIDELLQKNVPMFGACYGAQQITKTLGYPVKKASKEVGWAPVYLKSEIIPNVPKKIMAFHWHEECFEIPKDAQLLFSSDLLVNQGFLLKSNIIGLQFHFEPTIDDVREIVINDFQYTKNNLLNQSASDILTFNYPHENKKIIYELLDFITKN